MSVETPMTDLILSEWVLDNPASVRRRCGGHSLDMHAHGIHPCFAAQLDLERNRAQVPAGSAPAL